jgi:hypothetical protein
VRDVAAARDEVKSLDRFDVNAWTWAISCAKEARVPCSLPVPDEQHPGF